MHLFGAHSRKSGRIEAVLSNQHRILFRPGHNTDMSSSEIRSFVGVYNADAGLLGEAKYVMTKLTGRGSCELCDITHGLALRGKAAWRVCTADFEVPIRTFHRNDQPPAVAAVSAGRLPCVVAEHSDGVVRMAWVHQHSDAR